MIIETILWWLAAEFLGMAAFPIVEKLAGSALLDKGYSVSKIFGLISVTYAVWILASLRILKYGPVSIALAVLALLAASAAFFFDKARHVPMLKRLIKADVVFTLAFLFFVFVVRAHNPDIAGAEKPMDFAILNSIGRSEYFPPQDPWFAGNTLPYYYMGHLSVSILAKMTGTSSSPAVSYNLAVAMMFALAATAAFGIGYDMTGKKSGGLLAVFLVLLAGNLSSVLQFIGYLPSWQALAGWDYWKASRVITDTINEFPYFTFLHADLHAHLFSIPVQLLLLSVVLGVWLSGTLSIPLVALSLGYLIPLHSWDYPLYLALILAVAIMASNAKRALIAAAGSVLLYSPFLISYGSRSLGLALSAKPSPLSQFVLVYGAFMAIIYLFLFSEERNNTLRTTGIAILALAVFLQNSILAMVPMALLSASRLRVSKKRGPAQFALFLALAGPIIAIFIEIFYVADGMPPPWERMNTVFRLGEVAWILLALASAFCLSELFQKYRKWKPIGIAAILLLSAFFVFATGSRSGWFSRAPPSLDGTSWMAERASIDWLNKNIEGTSVILEASGRDYESGSRISSATGLPTVIGWPGHEVHWRQGAGNEINERIADTDKIYSTTDWDEARTLLDKYGTKYVFVGVEERKKYPQVGLDKFASRFPLEYSDNLVQIYRAD